jgi:CDP-diacylglycerol--glycerol-3-phosphate 3-phosphatidyltransferase
MQFSIYNLKNKFQDLLMPLCKKINLYGITPNQITVMTTIFSITFSIIFYKFSNKDSWLFISIPIFFLIRMALNALDGMIANRFDKKTKLGIYFNEIGDLISDTVFFFCFFSVLNLSNTLSLVFIFISILSEYVGVIGVQVDNKRHYEGPMGKSDRAFFISILSILIFYGIEMKYIKVFIIFSILLLLSTVYNRIKNSLTN